MSSTANVCVVIPAAGLGERLGLNQPKAFVNISNYSLLTLTIKRVLEVDRVGHIIVAVPSEFKDQALENIDRAIRETGRKIPFETSKYFPPPDKWFSDADECSVSATWRTAVSRSCILGRFWRSAGRLSSTPDTGS